MENNDHSMKDKICIITGATSGIGKATALGLARLGAKTVIIGRNKDKCQATLDEIKNSTGNTDGDYLVSDLSSQEQIVNLAQEIKKRYEHIDVLINNAGGIFYKYQESVDGIEMTFALNHLAYFLLTNLLLDLLKAGAPSRIINVSSRAHLNAHINFRDLNNKGNYHSFRAYGQSKLANLLFTYELARRLQGTGVTVNALHPGFVASNFGNSNNSYLVKLLMPLAQLAGGAISPEKGAETSIYLASSPDVAEVTGKYFSDKKAVPSSPASYNEEDAKRLWQVSLDMLRVPVAV